MVHKLQASTALRAKLGKHWFLEATPYPKVTVVRRPRPLQQSNPQQYAEWLADYAFATPDEYVASDGDLGAPAFSPLQCPSCGLSIQPGATILMGTAGTGKTTALGLLEKDLENQADVYHLDCFEPVPGAQSPDDMFAAIGSILTSRPDWTKPLVVVVDSLRFLSVLSSGYAPRLASGAMDLTLLAAITQLDLLAQRFNIAIVASLFFNLYQVTRGDATNEAAIASGLRTFAIDVDGSCQQTILMGPTRREAGCFESWSRRSRQNSVTGRFKLDSQQATAAEPRQVSRVPLQPIIAKARLTGFMQATAPKRGPKADQELMAQRSAKMVAEQISDLAPSDDQRADNLDQKMLESNFTRGIPPALREAIFGGSTNK